MTEGAIRGALCKPRAPSTIRLRRTVPLPARGEDFGDDACTTGLTIRDRAANALVMTDTSSPADISTLSFEAALAELEAIVGKLERGDVPLDESVDLYARGDALRAHCEARLNAAQARIDKISLDAGGKPSGSVPFDAN